MTKSQFQLPRTIRLKDGRNCVVNAVVEDDAAELLEFLPQTHCESDFLGYLQGEFNMTLEQEKESIRSQTSVPNAILLAARYNNRIVATFGAMGSKLKRSAHQTEIGISIVKEFWGAGLGRALMECLIEWGQARGLRRLTLRVFDDNERGIKLYRSLGFIDEGLLVGDAIRADGRYSDTILMAKSLV